MTPCASGSGADWRYGAHGPNPFISFAAYPVPATTPCSEWSP